MIPYSFNPHGIDDIFWLRQIRDANTTSQLPSLWLDTEDPYTQWEGVTWNEQKTKVIILYVNNTNVSDLNKINKLTSLQYLNCNSNVLSNLNLIGLNLLTGLDCYSNQLTSLNLTGVISLQYINCSTNQLTSIPTLTSKGNITYYRFAYNNLTTAELERLNSLGFTDENNMLPQNP